MSDKTYWHLDEFTYILYLSQHVHLALYEWFLPALGIHAYDQQEIYPAVPWEDAQPATHRFRMLREHKNEARKR